MKKPLYVKIGLFAVPTRKAAKNYLYFCFLLILLSVVAGFLINERYFAGLALLFAAFWYEVSIRWMDSNNAWESKVN